MAPATSSWSRWFTTDQAFILNYVDHCLAFQKDYKKTVVKAFADYAGRELSLAAIRSKLNELVGAKINGSSTLVRSGTGILDAAWLPADLLGAMQKGRKALGLEELDLKSDEDGMQRVHGTVSPTASTQDDAPSIGSEPSEDNIRVSNRIPREQTVPGSSPSLFEDSADLEHDDPPAKRQRLGHATATMPNAHQSKRGRPRKLASGTHQTGEHLEQQDSDANSSSSESALTRKRKRDNVEVVEMETASPEPQPKRATVSADRDGTITSEVFVPSSRLSHEYDSDQPIDSPSRVPTTVSGTAEATQNNVTHGQDRFFTTESTPSSQKPLAAHPATSHPPTNDDSDLAKNVKDLTDLLYTLLREQAIPAIRETVQAKRRHMGLVRIIKEAPGELLSRTLQDLHTADEARADQLEVMLTLLDGQHSYDVSGEFPRARGKKELDGMWKELGGFIKNAFRFNDSFKPLPQPEDAGYVAGRMEELAKDPSTVGSNASFEFVEEIAVHLNSPHLARSVLGALLCQWLFAGPEVMCDDVYSAKERKLYEAKMHAGGAEEVQQLDRVSMKLLFDDQSFQARQTKGRSGQLLALLKSALSSLWPDASGLDKLASPEDWADKAVALKQTLMLDPNDFRIRFCKAGTQFDPSWMEAEDNIAFGLPDGKATGKKVAACLFPALSKHEASPLPERPTSDTLDSLLVTNKRYFPSFEEKLEFDPQKVVSKAVVLVL